MTTYHMPAGTYYFGDPCYVIKENWVEVLNDTDFMEDFSNTRLILRAGSTAYGDGEYHGSDMFSGYQFSVDAGILGFVPIEEITSQSIDSIMYGIIITMADPFVFEIDDGVFRVDNRVVVDTRSYEEEDDYQGAYEDEDEYVDEMI